MAANKFTAGERFPDITLPRLAGGEIELAKPQGGNDWQLVVVYRGKHCPLCTRYLTELNSLVGRFTEFGVGVVAVSADPEEKARAQMEDIGPIFPIAYGLRIEQMKALGLYISRPRSPFRQAGPGDASHGLGLHPRSGQQLSNPRNL
jgi:peroxiredoxin